MRGETHTVLWSFYFATTFTLSRDSWLYRADKCQHASRIPAFASRSFFDRVHSSVFDFFSRIFEPRTEFLNLSGFLRVVLSNFFLIFLRVLDSFSSFSSFSSLSKYSFKPYLPYHPYRYSSNDVSRFLGPLFARTASSDAAMKRDSRISYSTLEHVTCI